MKKNFKIQLKDTLASEQADQFRKFITSPTIIQLSIGVIVGGSLTDLIKSVISLASNLFYFMSLLLFSPRHTANLRLVLDPSRTVFENVLTLCAIAACVFFFVKLINKFLVKNASEAFGYNAQLEETKKLLKAQQRNNDLLEQSLKLQKELLKNSTSSDKSSH
ncbi:MULTISPECIES: MscL family protein [Oenococcus]|uniref:Large-conductance mechanosensitive channel n=1 Tax=Oenococcus kitaharae DSM 17330 TaxID=1045004 RepID=G9WER8_9LACO|nr:MscL family protein [Oenococcus kitaharae]EHN58241.1 Large-conductance mechanosensitive channel [Oenococcus kitaharae DSM 17330]OEY81573.1 mechanosensitive ion channel protein MscL [Oenococcus kitaharae]OEY83059.1 mechanosensitive ion channel protein MscL [Oenococcus kitaharae]OEY84395.1 mechanosensitive ion channel protein MscL [Oenococcus kitaharae]